MMTIRRFNNIRIYRGISLSGASRLEGKDYADLPSGEKDNDFQGQNALKAAGQASAKRPAFCAGQFSFMRDSYP